MTWHEPLKNREGKSPIHQEVSIKDQYKDTLRSPIQPIDKQFQEINKKIDISDKIERSNGKDYTISATLKNFMLLLQDNNPSKIKKLTEEIDHYIKLGIGCGMSELSEVKESVQLVYVYAMDKRKLFTKPVDTKPIDDLIEFLSQMESDPYTTVRKGFISLRELLREPWKFGLYEETQFSTPKQEINWEIKLSKQRFKKDAFGLSDKMEQRLDAVKDYYK